MPSLNWKTITVEVRDAVLEFRRVTWVDVDAKTGALEIHDDENKCYVISPHAWTQYFYDRAAVVAPPEKPLDNQGAT